MYNPNQLHEMAENDHLNADLLPPAIADAANWTGFYERQHDAIAALRMQAITDRLWDKLGDVNSHVLDTMTYELLNGTAVGTA